jgi:hypothetical protein
MFEREIVPKKGTSGIRLCAIKINGDLMIDATDATDATNESPGPRKRIAVLVYGRLCRAVDHYANIVEIIGRNHIIEFFMSSDDAPSSQLCDFIRTYRPVRYDNTPVQSLWRTKKSHFHASDEMHMKNVDKML